MGGLVVCIASSSLTSAGEDGARCKHILLPESTLQFEHEFFQVNAMHIRKLLLAQKMVRIQILAVMSRAKRDRREVRGLLCHPPSAQNVRVSRFSNACPMAYSQTDCASKCPNPSQIVEASARPRRGRHRFFRTWTLRFGGNPRGKGKLRRDGTRLLSTNTSISVQLEDKRPAQGRRNGILSWALFVYRVVTS